MSLYNTISIFLLRNKGDGLAKETCIQMDAVADGLATCMWTVGTLMKLYAESRQAC